MCSSLESNLSLNLFMFTYRSFTWNQQKHFKEKDMHLLDVRIWKHWNIVLHNSATILFYFYMYIWFGYIQGIILRLLFHNSSEFKINLYYYYKFTFVFTLYKIYTFSVCKMPKFAFLNLSFQYIKCNNPILKYF